MPSSRRKTDDTVQSIEIEGHTWVNVSLPTPQTLAKLKERYPFFLDIDLKNCLPPFQRPKLLERDDYLFLVLLFPVYDPKTRKVAPTEVDFFIGKDFVVTSHGDELPDLAMLAKTCGEDDQVCKQVIGDRPGKVLYSVLHQLQISVFPIVTRIGNDILDAERQVFDERGHATIKEIMRIKSNIVQCRQAMQGHRSVIRKFVVRAEKFFDTEKLKVYYDDLVDHTQEIWDYLQNDKETIDAVSESHLSLVTYNTNDAMKKLAALALVVFPTTLVASIFSMNADHVPIHGSPYDFWIMLGFVGATMIGTIIYLHRKRWL